MASHICFGKFDADRKNTNGEDNPGDFEDDGVCDFLIVMSAP